MALIGAESQVFLLSHWRLYCSVFLCIAEDKILSEDPLPMPIAIQYLLVVIFLYLLGPHPMARASSELNSTTEISVPNSQSAVSAFSRHGEVRFGLLGRKYDDDIVNSRYAHSEIGLNLNTQYRGWLVATAVLEQDYTTGSASNLYEVTDGNATANGTHINEISLLIRPFSFASLAAGILPVGLNPTLSVMDLQNWMAARMSLDWRGESAMLSFIAKQAAPSASDTSNRMADEDTLPLFTTGSIKGEAKSSQLGLNLGLGLTEFVFTDLSSKTAQDSLKRGSTVFAKGKGTYQFESEFAGREISVDLTQKVSANVTLGAAGVFSINDRASDGHGKSSLMRIESQFSFKAIKLSGHIDQFRIESDAVPSVYGQNLYGFTNRTGQVYGLQVELPSERVRLHAEASRADVLNKNSNPAFYQADRDIYSIGAEISYALF